MPFALFSQRSLTHSSHLRRAARLGLGLLSLGLVIGQSAQAGTVTWDGTTADWFSNPSHWVGGSYPGSGDDAQNNTAAAMTLGQSTTVSSFFSNGAFSLTGGTFSGSQANAASLLTINNVFTDNGGGITNFTINQGTGGSVIFTTSGGNGLDSDIVNANLDLATNSNAYVRLFNTNTFNGSISLGASGSNGIHLYNSASDFVLGTNGSLTGFGSVTQDNGGATFTNNGTVNANSSGTLLSITTDNFTNSGTAEATNGGTLSLANNTTTTNTGVLAATGGGVLDISGTLNSNAGNSINGVGGTVNVLGASLLGTVNETSGTTLVYNTSAANNLNNTTINGNLDLATNSNAYVQLIGTDTVYGSISLGASGSNGIHLYNSASDFVLGTGSSLTGFGSVTQDNGGATFTNNGTVNANSSGILLSITTDNFTNSGTAEATNGGTLSLANNTTTTNTGLLAATGGGVLDISGTLNSNAGNSINGVGGTVNVLGASLLGTVNETAGTTLVYNTSAANNFNNTTINGNLDLATNNNAYVQLVGTDTVNGNISLGAIGVNGIHLYNSASSFVLGTGGNLTGFGSVTQDNGGATFTNNGTINANSAGNPLALTLTNFNNNGTAEATNGATLSLSNTFTNAAAGSTIAAAGTGSIVGITGTFTGVGSNLLTTSGGGQIQINGASLLGTINTSPSTFLVYNTSAANNFSNTTINGNLDLATNSNAYVQLVGTDTVNGNINLGANGSNGIHLYNSASSFVLNGSLIGFGSVTQDNGGATFTNNGTVNANSSGTLLSITTDNFTNSGTAEATNGGILTLANNTTTTNTGVLAATGGGVLDISGTLNSNAGNSINGVGGTVNVLGASLLGTVNETSGTTLVYNTSAANNLNNTTINGNLDLATNNNAYVQLVGTDTVNGNISLGAGSSNGIHLYNSASSFVLGTGGNLTGFGSVTQDNGGATFTNNGTVNASSVGNTLNINTSNFSNTGTTEVQSGAALSVTSATTDSGNILVKNGGTATFSQGVTQTAGLTQVDGTLNSPLTLTGGTLKGTGLVNGNVINNGGTVAAGDSPGTLSVSGNYTQASGGTLNAQFTNAASSLLTVSGLVTLDGTLDVNYIDTAAYTGTGPFTFLDYGTLSASTNSLGLTQYFANEVVTGNDTGLINGHDGFTYELINDTANNALQLQVLTNGAPVPEASTTVSMGLLLALGGVGLWRVKRRGAAVR